MIPAHLPRINTEDLIVADISGITVEEKESSIFNKNYVIAGIVILSVFLIYYYHTDIWKYFTSHDDPHTPRPKIVEIDGRVLQERIERTVVDPSSMGAPYHHPLSLALMQVGPV